MIGIRCLMVLVMNGWDDAGIKSDPGTVVCAGVFGR